MIALSLLTDCLCLQDGNAGGWSDDCCRELALSEVLRLRRVGDATPSLSLSRCLAVSPSLSLAGSLFLSPFHLLSGLFDQHSTVLRMHTTLSDNILLMLVLVHCRGPEQVYAHVAWHLVSSVVAAGLMYHGHL